MTDNRFPITDKRHAYEALGYLLEEFVNRMPLVAHCRVSLVHGTKGSILVSDLSI